MFYAHFVLSKKGPLARIWLAAHWDKKLTKAHVFETNIESSVEGILQPKVKMALRTSGHLLLGVVRIYSRKAKYLLADCNEAFIKIKMAFRPGVVDLPEENREAAVATITLPEVFHDFDTAMPDLNDIDMHTQFTLNQSRAEEITMREDYGNITLVGDDGFGDMGFEDAEIVREASNMEDTLSHASLLFGDKKDKDDVPSTATGHLTVSAQEKHIDMELDAPLRDDGFGGGVGEGLLSAETEGLFEPGGLFDDAPMERVSLEPTTVEDHPPPPSAKSEDHKQNDSEDDDYYDVGPPSMGAPSSGMSSPAEPVPISDSVDNQVTNNEKPPEPAPAIDQTVLIQNEEETFALAPLDSTMTLGIEKSKAKRKRKLIVDEVKNISGEEMKSQLSDTSDIVTTLDLAPPTKRLMHWKETGGVEKLFALPGHPIPSRSLSKAYQRHLTTRAVENEDFGMGCEEDPMELEPENQKEIIEEPIPLRNENPPTRPSRKRHHEPDVVEQTPALITPPALENSLLPSAAAITQLDESLNQFVMQLNAGDDSTTAPIVTSEENDFLSEAPIQQAEVESNHPAEPKISSNQNSEIPTVCNALQEQLPLQSLHTDEPKPTNEDSVSVQQENRSVDQHENCIADMQESEKVINKSDVLLQDERTMLKQQNSEIDLQEGIFPTGSDEANYLQELRPQPTPYNPEEEDEMECPASVGPPDEQGADETYEQFEERVLNKRAQQMLHVVKSRLERQDDIKFSEIVRLNTRKQVAQKFYTFLVLKKQQAVELTQEIPFGELLITRGPKLHSFC